MQYTVLAVMLLWTRCMCRRIVLLRRQGMLCRAGKCYRQSALTLGLLITAAMLAQEIVLWRCGRLNMANALPLHLCSMLGVLTLPMLLSRSVLLWHAAVYAGVPGALLAVLFLAVLDTPWPRLTALMFHVLHAGLVAAPLLPAAMGLRLRPRGALTTWALLLAAALVVMWVNGVTGGNYLFLEGPVAGTPLMTMASHGPSVYRLLLAGAASAVLLAEGTAVFIADRFRQKSGLQSPES